MKRANLHPNTTLLLDAWQKLDQPESYPAATPLRENHPDLIDALFVIERHESELWMFRNAGHAIERILGRSIRTHDFLPLWTGHDRMMISGFLNAVLESRLPGIVETCGETLNGQTIHVELAFTPIGRNMSGHPYQDRLLGLYQITEGQHVLKDRPVWRHRLTALHPPVARHPQPFLKLVANNN